MTMTADQVDILRRTIRTRALSRISGARDGRGHRYGQKFSAARETDLLAYAATLPDEDILGWSNTGHGILGWIRTHQPKGGMTITTEAGKYVIAKARWDEGMRGHFIRMFTLTGPQDVEIMVRKIEAEAVTAALAEINASEAMWHRRATLAEAALDALAVKVGKVPTLMRETFGPDPTDITDLIDRAAVLALIAEARR